MKGKGRRLLEWLDKKKEADLIKSVYITDPYVTQDEDIFDLIRGGETDLDDLYDEVIESGVDTREEEY